MGDLGRCSHQHAGDSRPPRQHSHEVSRTRLPSELPVRTGPADTHQFAEYVWASPIFFSTVTTLTHPRTAALPLWGCSSEAFSSGPPSSLHSDLQLQVGSVWPRPPTPPKLPTTWGQIPLSWIVCPPRVAGWPTPGRKESLEKRQPPRCPLALTAHRVSMSVSQTWPSWELTDVTAT